LQIYKEYHRSKICKENRLFELISRRNNNNSKRI
jgi:hypothetical protein